MVQKKILLLLALLFLSGCNEKPVENITLQAVVQAFDSNTLPLTKSENADYFVLNGQSPEKYAVNGNPLYIYVFASEEDAKKGLEDFLNQTEKLNMVIPQIFAAKNVLIFYLSSETRTDSFSERDEKILSIVNSISVKE
ncbi:hypothetical protein HPY28_13845 [Brevibacillus sp. HB1.2]|uniref:hypothetical protein n=1 Tax=Brevibacillus sp. HB1.2 TaxID=2738807 RepID=UPI0003641E2A|nr:hypothetical protein [Brevibacillus sp. HB1.2]ATF11070.1 hypothetical protein A616_03325 [Brevibacillus brevis X23]NTU21407.1 hypothetical protein [Brevibacillus sp. HB1.2]